MGPFETALENLRNEAVTYVANGGTWREVMERIPQSIIEVGGNSADTARRRVGEQYYQLNKRAPLD